MAGGFGLTRCKRPLQGGVVILVTLALSGCPQLVDDSFDTSQETAAPASEGSGEKPATVPPSASSDRPIADAGADTGRIPEGVESIIHAGTGGILPIPETGGWGAEQPGLGGFGAAGGGSVGQETSGAPSSSGGGAPTHGGADGAGSGGSGGESGVDTGKPIPTAGTPGSSGGASGHAGAPATGPVAGIAGAPLGGVGGEAGVVQARPGGSSGAGGAEGAAGDAGTTGSPGGATAGAGGEATDCSNKVVLAAPLVADFDDWDGTDVYDWEFRFDTVERGGEATGGFLEYQDGTGEYTLEFVAGADGSPYAVSARNPAASNWGGGVSVWVHCLDASSFDGLQFWLKGRSPRGTIEVSMELEDGSTASQTIEPTLEWKLYRIPFARFASGETDGNGVSAIIFSSQLVWVQKPGTTEWEPAAGAFEVTVDGIGFYRTTI